MVMVAEYVCGAAIVLMVLSDIFRTVLLPRPTHRALRLGPVLGTTLAPLWRRMAGCLRSRTSRQTVRASLGPLLLVLSIAIWVTVIVLGYALMLHARAGDMQPRPSFADAVFHAGSAFMTIGFTDVSIHGPSRLTVVLAGMTGLAGVTILATFILSVQSALQVREVPVIQLAATAKCPPTGMGLLLALDQDGCGPRLADLFRTWSKWSAAVLHDHRANPVLMNFRSADEQCEWLAALAAMLDAASILVAFVDRDSIAPGGMAVREFHAVGSHAVKNLASIFRAEAGPGLSEDSGPEKPSPDVDRLKAMLAEAGFRLRDDPSGLARLDELRAHYMPDIVALGEQFDILVAPTFRLLQPAG